MKNGLIEGRCKEGVELSYRIGAVDKLPWLAKLNHTFFQIVQGPCKTQKAVNLKFLFLYSILDKRFKAK